MMMAHLFSLIYGVSFILIGLSHLREPQKFVDIVPSYLPYALFLVYLTGIMEIAGGIGIIYPETRKITGRLLVIFLIAVFPANIHLIISEEAQMSINITKQTAIIRAPFQLLFIGLAYWHSKP